MRLNYENSNSCRGCHTDLYEQHRQSEHASAFTNPLFSTQYFNVAVPKAQNDKKYAKQTSECLSCHSPVVFMNVSGFITSREQTGEIETGIPCDFCHTLVGLNEDNTYKKNLSRKKLGPFPNISSWHTEYSPFLQSSEFCGPCHNASIHSGIELKSTYSEWKDSRFAKDGIQCQHCHMSMLGYAKSDDKGTYQYTGPDTIYKAPERPTQYAHSFPGAHSQRQIEGAIKLDISAESGSPDSLKILVDNGRTGHYMPTGCVEIRFMWLDVKTITVDGAPVPAILLSSSAKPGRPDYGVAGEAPEDAALFENTVKNGARLYRTLFHDKTGKMTNSSFEAAKIVFDNRLKAGEIRVEPYRLDLPDGYKGDIVISAVLSYMAAPESFTKNLGLDRYKPVQVASITKTIKVSGKRK